MFPWDWVVWRSLVLSVELLVIARWMGKRVIGSFSAVDFVVSITIGTITGDVIVEHAIGLAAGVIALAFWAVFEWANAWLSQRSGMYRKIAEGETTVLVRNGKIDSMALKRAQVPRNTLLSELRAQKISNLADVEIATLEPSGKIGIKSVTEPLPHDRRVNLDLFALADREEHRSH